MSSCHAPDSLASPAPVQDSTDAESFTSAVDMDLVAGDELSIVGGTKRAGGCPSAGHVGGSAVASPSATARTVADDKVACTSPHWTLASPQSGRLAAWTAVLLLGGSRPMAWSCSSDANLGAPTDRTDEPHAQPLTALLDPATSAKIRCDTHRTFRGHQSFEERVGEEALQELLEAFASDVEEAHRMLNLSETKTPIDVLTSSYVQGMNVHAGMLLYVVASDIQTHIQDSHQLARATLPLLKNFLLRHCPTYVQPSLDGVHAAVVLLQMVLKVVDPELNAFLERAGLVPEMYAFPSLLTFSACTPPLEEAVHLWDFLLSNVSSGKTHTLTSDTMHASTYQTEATTTEPPTITLSSSALHWNVPCVVAQLTLERDVILSSNNPMSVLRHLPTLRASEIIQEARHIMDMLPCTLIDDLRGHLWDMRVVRRLLASASHSVPSTMEYDEMAWFQDATLATLGEADNIARFSLNGQAKLEGHIQADAAHACESYDDGFEWEDD